MLPTSPDTVDGCTYCAMPRLPTVAGGRFSLKVRCTQPQAADSSDHGTSSIHTRAQAGSRRHTQPPCAVYSAAADYQLAARLNPNAASGPMTSPGLNCCCDAVRRRLLDTPHARPKPFRCFHTCGRVSRGQGLVGAVPQASGGCGRPPQSLSRLLQRCVPQRRLAGGGCRCWGRRTGLQPGCRGS